MTDFFKIPNNCKINQKIKVEDFLKRAPLNHVQKLDLKANTLNLRVISNITPEKTGITPVRLSDADYPEIQIIEVDVYAYRFCKYEFSNFTRLFFRTIPYPLILITRYNHGDDHYVRFATSNFHEGKIDTSKNIQESIVTSKWIDVNHLYSDDCILLDDISSVYSSYSDLYNMYAHWTDAFVFHNSGSQGNYIINYQEDTYRKKEMREYHDDLEEKRKQFRLDRKKRNV